MSIPDSIHINKYMDIYSFSFSIFFNPGTSELFKKISPTKFVFY